MRKAERLDYFYDEKCRLHKKYLPDWRVGQLDSNFYGWLTSSQGKDMFFPEEDEMLKWFKTYIKEMVGERFED
jgi:hypothetical protein